MLDLIHQLVDLVLHIDVHLDSLAASVGAWLYLVLFAIVFCESGLVVLAVLPGDSLLFATGALAARPGSPLDVTVTAALLITAAVVGDFVNYALGAYLGPQVFTERSRFLNRKYVERTEAFYAKYGKKTIFLSRFVPIVRTFAIYNVTGGASWVLSCLLAGFYFGQLPFVRDHFSAVVLGIVFVSVLPLAWEFVRARQAERAKA